MIASVLLNASARQQGLIISLEPGYEPEKQTSLLKCEKPSSFLRTTVNVNSL